MNYQYEHSIDESSNRQARQMSDFSLEFPQLSDSLAGPEVHRQERDGGAHVHGHGGGGRSGVRNQRQQQEERGEQEEQVWHLVALAIHLLRMDLIISISPMM